MLTLRYLFRRATIWCVPLLLAGCATARSGDDIADVQASLQSRGGPDLHLRERDADERVADTTRQLLSQPLTPTSVIDVAMLNNPSLRVQLADLGVARADLIDAGLLENPMFDGKLRFGEGGSGTIVEVALVQDFISIFQIPLRKRLARTELARAKADAADAVLVLQRDVLNAYADVQAAQQMLELRQTVAQATEASLDAATRLREAGNIPALTVSNEAAAHEAALLEVQQAELHLAGMRAMLVQQLGVADAGESIVIDEKLAEPAPAAVDAAALEQLAMTNRFDIRAAALARQSAEQALAGTRRFRGFGKAEAGGGADRELDGEWSFGPNLALPLPIFNHGQGTIARGKAQVAVAKYQQASVELQARTEVRTAATKLNGAQKRVAQFRDRLLPLRQEIVEQTQAQYNAMQIGIFDLLRARQEQISTGADYLDALNNYWHDRAELQRAVGGALPASLNVAASQPTTTPAASQSAPPMQMQMQMDMPMSHEHNH